MNAKQRRKANRSHKVKFSFDVLDLQDIRTFDRELTYAEIMAELKTPLPPHLDGRWHHYATTVKADGSITTSVDGK